MNNNMYRIEDGVLTGFLGDREKTDELIIPPIIGGLRKYCLSNINTTKITFPSTINCIIRRHIIYNCPNLTTVFIPNHINLLDRYFAEDCPNLTNIEVSEDNHYFHSVDGFVFNRDNELVICPIGKKGEVKIPEGPTQLNFEIFDKCDQITKLYLPVSLKEIKFPSEITIPKSLKEIVVGPYTTIDMKHLIYEDFLEEVTVSFAPENPYYLTEDGCAYDLKENRLIYVSRSKNGVVTLPPSITCLKEDVLSYRKITGFVATSENFDFICSGKNKYRNDYIFSGCDNLEFISVKNKKAKIKLSYFPTRFFYAFYEKDDEDRLKAYKILSYIYPSQLEEDDIKSEVKKVIKLITVKDIEVQDEWKNEWISYFVSNIKKYAKTIIEDFSFLKLLCDSDALNKKNIHYLLERSGKNVDANALLLEYENANYSCDDLIEMKTKEFEKALNQTFNL